MAHRPNASAPDYSYEYYLDYVDLIPVDEKKLKANKSSLPTRVPPPLPQETRARPAGGSARRMGHRPPRQAKSRSESGTLARTQAAGPGCRRDRPRAEDGDPPPRAPRHGNGPAGGDTSGDRLRSRAPPALPPLPADLCELVALPWLWSERNNAQHHRTRPWRPGLNCPLCPRGTCRAQGTSGTRRAPLTSVEEPDSRAPGPEQRLQAGAPPPLLPLPPSPRLLSSGTGPGWGPQSISWRQEQAQRASPGRQTLSIAELTPANHGHC
ncbi:hypothetical protein MC885_003322 [Smutsia gigantea]|nr:hypothetical protein MC885_003322 [Smutsia gigantea]